MKSLVLTPKIIGVAALLFIAAGSLNANLVVNGGFETGTFSGWNLVDTSGLSNVGSDPLFAHSGTYHANLGTTQVPPGPSNIGSLSQNLATTSGQLYTLSFWLANDVTTVPPKSLFTSFEVFWNNTSIFSLISPPPFGYTNFAFPNLVATGPSTTLEFRYQHDNDFWRLDDVTVNVPESGSAILMALPVFALLGLLHLRLRSKPAAARS